MHNVLFCAHRLLRSQHVSIGGHASKLNYHKLSQEIEIS